MSDEGTTTTETTVVGDLQRTREAMSVRGVFGEPYEVGDVTIIPVARIAGGGGGGGGEGNGPDEQGGKGFGTGFGIKAHPVGVYEVRDGTVVWRPTIDATQLARGGQIIGGLAVIGLTLVLLRHRRR